MCSKKGGAALCSYRFIVLLLVVILSAYLYSGKLQYRCYYWYNEGVSVVVRLLPTHTMNIMYVQ